jgi:hypothetical protein
VAETPEGQIISAMKAQTVAELKRAFHQYAVGNWMYSKASAKKDPTALLDGKDIQCDCHRLANAFVRIAQRFNFQAASQSARPTQGDLWLMNPGLTTFDGQTGDFGNQWIFDSHAWVTMGGSAYDPLFHKDTGNPEVANTVQDFLTQVAENRWRIGRTGEIITRTTINKSYSSAEWEKMRKFVERNKGDETPEIKSLTSAFAILIEQQPEFEEMTYQPLKKKGCYLTTACVEAQGLPDDCHELTVLRRFRDGYMKSIPGGEALIAEYYETAPVLLEKLRAEPDVAEQLEAMYRRIAAVVETIEAGRNAEALAAYMDVALELEQRYQDSPALARGSENPGVSQSIPGHTPA